MANSRVRRLALLLGGVAAALAVACSGDDAPSGNDGVVITPITSNIPTLTPAPRLIELTGFGMPIAGGCLPNGDQLMPNAPRTYRNGTHEGIDFYAVDNCTAIARGTQVLAAFDGKVVRADLAYTDLTQAENDRFSLNPNTDAALDSFRGRQVWVDHGVDATGQAIITRYAHLSGIAPGINVGMDVVKGQLIAFVGNSGTPESISNPSSEMHLHWELRVGDSYLGRALPAVQVRSLYVTLFAQPPAAAR